MKNSIPILPKSVALELTYKCNHHCLFCSCPWYAPNSSYPLGKELSTTQWKWVIEKLYDYGVKTFSLSGGEALLRDDLHHWTHPNDWQSKEDELSHHTHLQWKIHE